MKRMAPREITRRRAYVAPKKTRTRTSSVPTAISRESRAVGMGVGAGPFRSALTGRVDRLGDDRHAVVLHGDEALVDGGGLLAALAVDDDVTGDEDPQKRGVAGQDAELAVHGARADHAGLAG